MSSTRMFALVFGLGFLLIGICGFVPPLLDAPLPRQPDMVIHAFDGRLFGLFHVNAIHSGIHVLFGVLGLAMCGSLRPARTYAQIVTVVYGLLGILGMIPTFYTLFGICPIHGNDIWLHISLALIASWFGFAKTPAYLSPNAPGAPAT